MEFDTTTFILELINFLILVWLLKHFFYTPILEVIQKRQAQSAQIISDANKIQDKANLLKIEYESKLAELDKEYATEKAKIDEDIALQREKLLKSLEDEIAIERKRREAMEDKERNELESALERKALVLAERFSTRLLERLAGPQLNSMLADLAISELDGISGERLEILQDIFRDPDVKITVVSAYPLSKLQHKSFTNIITKLANYRIVPDFSEDKALKSGVSVVVGSWVLMVNLRDELSFFSGNLEHEN